MRYHESYNQQWRNCRKPMPGDVFEYRLRVLEKARPLMTSGGEEIAFNVVLYDNDLDLAVQVLMKASWKISSRRHEEVCLLSITRSGPEQYETNAASARRALDATRPRANLHISLHHFTNRHYDTILTR